MFVRCSTGQHERRALDRKGYPPSLSNPMRISRLDPRSWVPGITGEPVESPMSFDNALRLASFEVRVDPAHLIGGASNRKRSNSGRAGESVTIESLPRTDQADGHLRLAPQSALPCVGEEIGINRCHVLVETSFVDAPERRPVV